MTGHHRQHDGVLLVGRKARPMERHDDLGADANDVRRPVLKKVHTSTPRLLRSRSTCLTPCLVNVPMAWAKPRPTAWIASDALTSTPKVALASDNTRLACRSSLYKVVMKFRRSCLRNHCSDAFARLPGGCI